MTVLSESCWLISTMHCSLWLCMKIQYGFNCTREAISCIFLIWHIQIMQASRWIRARYHVLREGLRPQLCKYSKRMLAQTSLVQHAFWSKLMLAQNTLGLTNIGQNEFCSNFLANLPTPLNLNKNFMMNGCKTLWLLIDANCVSTCIYHWLNY